jgi:methyl-accepting chemotaxis protein PixJ
MWSYIGKGEFGPLMTSIINDIYNEPGLTDCHIRTLERYQVKANLVAPIRKDHELIALLIVHQCSSPRKWQGSEIEFLTQLAIQVEYALDHLSFIEKIQTNASQAHLFGEIAFRARQSPSSQRILQLAVQGSQKILGTDRIIVLRINPDFTGTVVTEALAPNWGSLLHEHFDDPCFQERYLELYRNGRVLAIDDIYAVSRLTDCHIRVLERCQIRANLIAPIRRQNQLVALLIANQCGGPRKWQKAEVDFFYELATQVGYALDHISFIQTLKQSRQTAELASQEQRQQKELIQQQVKSLLQDLQGAFEGDLTVRARVTAGEIGTVAVFVNETIAHLQQLVLQVQAAAQQMAHTTHHSEADVRSLAHEAQHQAQSITLALEQIQTMTESIQGVAASAQDAQEKVDQANQTLEQGDQAMDQTVEGILTIQSTVEQTAQQVKRLGEASQKISRVLNLIRDLANQTNVLALNASIEAKGTTQESQMFAVVAEEVRSLAEQCTGATKEIEQIVEDIQVETQQVATAMELGRDQVVAGTALVETTRQHLTSIASVSGQIRILVKSMAQAAMAQAQTSKAVSQTMQAVEAMTQNSSVQSVAVAQSLTQLLGVAKELQESVTQFKVKEL